MRFSRGRGSGRRVHGEAGRAHDQTGQVSFAEVTGSDGAAEDVAPDGAGGVAEETDDSAGRAGVHSRGPYDVTEAPSGEQRLDLGSLRVPVAEGVEVRVQAEPDGTVQQIFLVNGGNALQLGVFAAPRSEGLWDEVRDEIRQKLRTDGAKVEEVSGEYGPELRARLRTPDGQTDMRFVGVDGPRWMVRATFYGRAAVEPAAAGPLTECLYGLVVVRGQEAKPALEPLPLRLPREMAEQAQAASETGTGGVAAPPGEPVSPASRPGRPRPRRG